MNILEEFRERKQRRRERIRKLVFGDTPRPSRLERVLVVLSIVAVAYVCYRFRLVHAHEFAVIGFGMVIAYFVLRRAWWRRKLGESRKSS